MKALHKLAFCILGEMVNFQNFDQRLLVIFWPIVDHSSLSICCLRNGNAGSAHDRFNALPCRTGWAQRVLVIIV
jgi:hypothetical protein